jgi:hypothetical protein
LKTWVEYFENLLNPHVGEQTNDNVGEIEGPDVLVEEPSYELVEKAIKELKNYKAPGEDLITAELRR